MTWELLIGSTMGGGLPKALSTFQLAYANAKVYPGTAVTQNMLPQPTAQEG